MVKAWKEKVVIPTYEVGKPEKNPIFLEKRVYQGSSGVVYPYPVIESMSNEKVDKEYNAIFIENEYIKVMILPELGGRVQMAYDKIRERHFIYYNHVIKPALVGLAGPWISGGIEFNWPQHHRPSTYMPVDTTIEENADGSVTVWVNEMERMFHQKGMAGFTLRPGHAFLEIKGVLYNRTEVPQTFLWWANPAVAVNDYYQSVFPPDINAVFDHGKRAVSSFPIATGTYYKMDYSAGVDISNYKNIKVPTSYMAVNSRFNFEGGTPEELLDETVNVNGEKLDKLILEITANGRELLYWHAEPEEVKPIPDAAEAALLPEEIKTTEQLYLTGLHLEQYRHATYNPVEYYEEALRRDPIDVRNNNALGLWYIRKGRFHKAEQYLLTAVKTLQKRNPNPYDGEPIYNLGLALKYQGRYNEAYDRFYKSCWNAAWQDAGYFACAQISTMQSRLEDALDEIDRSLIRNWHNHKARALKTAILRRMGRTEEALQLIEDSLSIDKFNFGCRYEKYLITNVVDELSVMKEMMRGEPHNYDEIALDYCAAGCWQEAASLWNIAIAEGIVTPMTYYYLGWCLHQGGLSGVKQAFADAVKACPDYCFPNRLEAILALQCAMVQNPDDARAPYYLGNLYYDKRQYDLAMEAWETSVRLDGSFPTVWRNLALAFFNKKNEEAKAIECMERAFRLDTTDARILMELDQLYKRVRRSHKERLAFLQQYPELIKQRDDLILEEITLLNQTGEYEKAKTVLDAHNFHPWEGGEGKVPAQYQLARVELAKKALTAGENKEAISLLEECLEYPHHLGEGKLYGAQENDFYYFLGCAYEGLGQHDKAVECWEQAIIGPTEPAAAMYYNDAKPDKIFYQGLALLKLGRMDEANGRFHKLTSYGEKHLFDKIKMDYFAVSLPDLLIWEDDLTIRNVIHCKYMMALGYWGLNRKEKSLRLLSEVERLDINHQGIQAFRSLIG